jgi:hypothetical protein
LKTTVGSANASKAENVECWHGIDKGGRASGCAWAEYHGEGVAVLEFLQVEEQRRFAFAMVLEHGFASGLLQRRDLQGRGLVVRRDAA